MSASERRRSFFFLVLLAVSAGANGFSPPLRNFDNKELYSLEGGRNLRGKCVHYTTNVLIKEQQSSLLHYKKNNIGDNEDNEPAPSRKYSNILGRFTSPVIDDPALPLSDVLVAQVIGPSIQIAWLIWQRAPQPTWLSPILSNGGGLLFNNARGSFVVPTLIHGAALSSCWIVGALAARAYEQDNIAPKQKQQSDFGIINGVDDINGKQGESRKVGWDYGSVLITIFKGGAFASGLLILSTQADLLLEYGRWVQVGESEEIDFRLLVAIVELINDVFFEAIAIASWRLYLAFQTERKITN